MIIKINGAESEVFDNASIQHVLSSRKLSDDGVIVELNGTIINRQFWGSIRLKSEDKLDIIRIIGGG